jgi:hypothetical protein
MTLKTDRDDVDTTPLPNGQQREYLVLSDEERAKGFVRPVRRSYVHVGIAGPAQAFPEGHRALGQYWKESDIQRVGKGCGTVTTMALALAETYARDPKFYGGTFCSGCRAHFPVGDAGEVVWDKSDGSRVGT